MSVVPFPVPVPTSCSGATMPGLTTPELRARAVLNYYSAERRQHVDPLTAWERSQAFGRDLDRIAEVVGHR